jgi:hypothetical protein
MSLNQPTYITQQQPTASQNKTPNNKQQTNKQKKQVVALWSGKADEDHVLDVATFIHYGGRGRFGKPQARDLSPSPTRGDPLYVVYAFKKG